MHFHVILNRDGGTLKTLDLDQLQQTISTTLAEGGHDVHFERVSGDELEEALDVAVAGDADVVMAGGGDGTISAAASRLAGTEKTLAILPAGTMNLFARSLGIPLQLEAAVACFVDGRIRNVDLGLAGERHFVHQFSVGLHAKLIRLRERREFASRLGKVRASFQAGVDAFLRPPRIRVDLTLDGTPSQVVTSSIGITNNLFGEGHMPYTDTPDEGVLGVYVTRAKRRRDLAKFVVNMAIGRWRANDQVDIRTAREVTLKISSSHRRFGCAIDGELCDLAPQTTLRILPGALKVLVPTES
jgi:diacylglycerol kinase family enzyme